MRRRLFLLTSLLSLLLCLAVVVLWVRSYQTDPSRPLWGTARRGVFSHDGGIKVFFWKTRQRPFFGEGVHWYWHGFGFTDSQPYLLITVPHWSIVFISAIVPLAWVFDRRRTVVGHCRKCGYSLTGNTSGTCPECGTAIPQTSRPA